MASARFDALARLAGTALAGRGQPDDGIPPAAQIKPGVSPGCVERR